MSRSGFLLAVVLGLFLLASVFSSESAEQGLRPAVRCNSKKCQLPDCHCSGATWPRPEFEGKEREIPQFVMVTFDDAVNTINFAQYQEIFEGLVNPDNCTAAGTFFVCHEYTDYTKVNALYMQGHEIALHSVTHGTGSEYWRDADVDVLTAEFGDQIEILETFAKVNRSQIRGLRLPFLQASGNNSYVAAQRLGLQYDSSWPTQRYTSPAMWPYTLDYRSTQDCQIGPCPEAAIPGFWVVPMVTWNDKSGYSCAMIDSCVYPPQDKEDALFEWMLENFNRHYEGNRAPFPMFLHAAWFSKGKHNFKAFKKFLLHLNSLPDVYIVPISRVLQYMHNPVLGKPFKRCIKKPQGITCKPRTCNLAKETTDETRYMTVCDHCPEVYPWLGNPFGKD